MNTRAFQRPGPSKSMLLILVSCIAPVPVLGGDAPDFVPIDIRAAANMGFTDEVADDQKGGWFDQGPQNDLSEFPTGPSTYRGIPFNVIVPEENDGVSCIVLRGEPRPYFPVESPNIPVGTNAAAISFLGACGWSASIDEPVVRMLVRYEDQRLYDDWPIRFGLQIGGWWRPQDLAEAEVIWRGESGASDVGIYQFYWINPYPDDAVESIQFVSTDSGAVPAIIAATAVAPTPGGRALVQGIQQQYLQADTSTAPEGRVPVTVDFSRKEQSIHPQAVSIAGGFGRSEIYEAPGRALSRAGSTPPLYRFQTHLAEPSPAEGVWDFEVLDGVIDFALRIEAEPMLCLSGRTKWMTDPNDPYGDPQKHWRPASIEEFADYAAHIVRRYNLERGTPVRNWQIGNEMELKKWTHEFYVEVYGETAKRMRAADPSIRLSGPVTCNPNIGWARQLLRHAGEEVDIVSFHQYGYSTPFDTPGPVVMNATQRYRDEAERYRALIRDEAGDPDLPLFITEANTNASYRGGTDPRIRTMFGGAWYASALTQFVRGGGDVFCWFTFDGGFGMVWNENLYPAFHVAWLLRSYFHGHTVATEIDGRGVDAVGVTSPEHHAVLVINQSDADVDVEIHTGIVPGPFASEYILNDETYDSITKTIGDEVPLLSPLPRPMEAARTMITMKPYEVRVLTWDLNRD